MSKPRIRCDGIVKKFGGVTALYDLSLTIRQDEITGIIGPNGAGKTTLFNVITGVLPPTDGEVYLDGEEISGKETHEICHLGVARTFQSPKPLESLTVEENLRVAQHFGGGDGRESTSRLTVQEVLEILDLESSADEHPDQMGIVDKKYIDLARALMTGATLVLVDEIMAGLTPAEKRSFIETFETFHDDFDIDFVVIEHDLQAIRSISDRLIVIHNGSPIATGTPEDVLQRQEVREAYAGV